MQGTGIVKGAPPPGGHDAAAHGYALALLIAGGLLLLALTVLLLARAAHQPERTGRFLALFPPSWSREATLLAVVAAEAVPVREVALRGTLEVAADTPGAARRLEAQGALLVLPALPSGLFGLGGCGFATLGDFPHRPKAGVPPIPPG